MKLKLNTDKLKSSKNESIETKKHTILLVDDEPANLDSMRMALDQTYNIITAQDGMEALEIVQQSADPLGIHLIISDQRMPNLTGVEFFMQAKEIIPDVVRIILTGYTDVDAIVSSINDGQIYKFLTKPIDNKELRLSVKQALELYDLKQENIDLTNNLEKKVDEKTSELNLRNKELESALEEVKQLSGLLPICSQCKSIRDGEGYWKRLEEYIESHSEAQFSHSICKKCAEELYSDEAWYQKAKDKM